MTLTLSRPAIIESDELRLDLEYRSARWIHHRLLDFEDEHQRVLDEAADAAAPGIVRVGRILARLTRRTRRAERTTKGQWSPNPHPELAARLRIRLTELRAVRDADPRWKEALGWADEEVGEPKQVRRRRAKPSEKIKRRKTETDEAFAKRFALLTQDETDEHYAAKLAALLRQTRREAYRTKLYSERRIYWGTWNALCKSVDQARRDVLKRRKQGLPAEWRRPKFRDPTSLAADAGGFRIVERARGWQVVEKKNEQMIVGDPWWTLEIRIGIHKEWVRFRAKCENWHEIPDDAEFTTCKLGRRKDGERWAYSVSLTVEGVTKKSQPLATGGIVALDWGHREHGHDRAKEGIRAFTWRGSDGRTGEILLPAACRKLADQIDELKARADKAYDARRATQNLPERNRYSYRRLLMRSGARTAEEQLWLRWEQRYERRIEHRRKRIQDLRRQAYLDAVRELRKSYAIFAVEDQRIHDAANDGPTIRTLQSRVAPPRLEHGPVYPPLAEDTMPRRRRANRELTARYEFLSICERFGAEILPVPSRGTTQECPECGILADPKAELEVVCPGCGTARDRDHGAAIIILRRAQDALANHAAE